MNMNIKMVKHLVLHPNTTVPHLSPCPCPPAFYFFNSITTEIKLNFHNSETAWL